MNYNIGDKGSPAYEALNGLYLHCYGVYHEGTMQDFGYYANKLDRLGVPMWVQNNVSAMAEMRTSIHIQSESSRIRSCCEM